MEILSEILLALHLIGMAIIVGGYFAVIRSPHMLTGMLHASYLQLVTGLMLVGIAEMGPDPVNHFKIGIKLVIAILVTIFAFIGNRKRKMHTAALAAGESVSSGAGDPSALYAHLTFAAALLNVLVAVFVH